MELEFLIEEAKNDLKYDKVNLSDSIHNIGNLISKWIEYHVQEKKIVFKLEKLLNELKTKKWLYYSGKSNPETYKKNPFGLKLLKTDVPQFIDSDPEILKIREELNIQNEKLFVIDEVVKGLKSRSFEINSIIRWNEYLQGK